MLGRFNVDRPALFGFSSLPLHHANARNPLIYRQWDKWDSPRFERSVILGHLSRPVYPHSF
jgi:hypothetical protein